MRSQPAGEPSRSSRTTGATTSGSVGTRAWGEDRLRAAHRTLRCCLDFPQAHWLAATVYVARQAFDEAERELLAGLAAPLASGLGSDSRFSSVALHWLLGLIWLSRGDEKRALEEFELELSFENSSHLYARECSANTRYAIGALELRQKRQRTAAWPSNTPSNVSRLTRWQKSGSTLRIHLTRILTCSGRGLARILPTAGGTSTPPWFEQYSWLSKALTRKPHTSSRKVWRLRLRAAPGGSSQSSRCYKSVPILTSGREPWRSSETELRRSTRTHQAVASAV